MKHGRPGSVEAKERIFLFAWAVYTLGTWPCRCVNSTGPLRLVLESNSSPKSGCNPQIAPNCASRAPHKVNHPPVPLLTGSPISHILWLEEQVLTACPTIFGLLPYPLEKKKKFKTWRKSTFSTASGILPHPVWLCLRLSLERSRQQSSPTPHILYLSFSNLFFNNNPRHFVATA